MVGGRRCGRRGGGLRLCGRAAHRDGSGTSGPADVLGWGPVHAELAADLALRLRSWWCVLVGADGSPQAVVPIRRRPTDRPGQHYVGEVWLHVDRDTLRFLDTLARAG